MTMGSRSVLVLVLVAISSVQSQEPKCYSTFDFQEKLLEKMIALSHSVETMEKQFAKKMEELTDLSEKLKEDGIAMEAYIKKLGNEKSSEINEMSEKLKEDKVSMETDLRREINHTVDIMTESVGKTIETANENIDELVKTNDAKFGRLSTDLYTLANATLKELQDSIKPSVAFLVRSVSNKAPGTNQKLIFTSAVLNTDNSYSTYTGEFTAPVGGTYWFSVQICLYNKKQINIRIYVNDTLMSASFQYDADGGLQCTTFNLVAILTKGDRVYVKTGPGSSSGNIIAQDGYRWNMFMGSLIN